MSLRLLCTLALVSSAALAGGSTGKNGGSAKKDGGGPAACSAKGGERGGHDGEGADRGDHGDRDHGDRDHGDRDHGDRDRGDRDDGDRDHRDGDDFAVALGAPAFATQAKAFGVQVSVTNPHRGKARAAEVSLYDGRALLGSAAISVPPQGTATASFTPALASLGAHALVALVRRDPDARREDRDGRDDRGEGDDDADGRATAQVTVVEAPAVSAFTAAPALIVPGGSATLGATFTGSAGVVDPGGLALASGGTVTVTPAATTTYTLTVTNAAGDSATASATVTVDAATAVVGTSGGTVTAPSGASLQLPFGALDGPTTITIVETALAPPGGIGAPGPVYEFDPAGVLLAKPVTIALPLPAGWSDGTIYCTALDGSGFIPIGGTVQNGVITLLVGDTASLGQCVVGAKITSRTVTGVGQITWLSATTRVTLPIDFAGQGVEAILPDGTHLAGVPGTGAAVGTFTIAGVPDGEYLLHSGQQWLYTSTSTPDLGYVQGGLPIDQRTPNDGAALLNVTVGGMDPWQDGDWIEFYSTEADAWDFQTDRFVVDAAGNYTTTYDDLGNTIRSIAPGATSAPLAIDFTGLAPSLILGSQGDHTLIAQLSKRTSGNGFPYLAMTGVAQVAPFDLAHDGPTSIGTVALGPVETANTLSVDYRGTQFVNALNQGGNPGHQAVCALCGGFVGVLAQAGDAEDGFYDANADPLLLNDNAATGTDMLTGPMSYGAPSDATLAGNWGLIFYARWVMRTPLQALPGTGGVRGGGLYFGAPDLIDWTTTTGAGQAGPVTPPVTLPAGLTVTAAGSSTGADFFAGGSNVGATPTISWTAPQTGADFYQVAVHHLVANGNNMTVAPVVASLITRDTAITLPAGILDASASGAWFFQVTAVKSTSAFGAGRLADAPFRNSIDRASALVSSGEFWTGAAPHYAALTTIASGQHYPWGLTVTSDAVYWAERGDTPWACVNDTSTGQIWTANLDGTNPHVIASGQQDPMGIAVVGSSVYWTNADLTYTVAADGTCQQQANGSVMKLDQTTGAVSTVATGQGYVGTAILGLNGALYWQGAGFNALLPGATTPSFLGWYGAVNLASDGTHLFWTDYGNYPQAPGGQVWSLPFSDPRAAVSLIAGQPQSWDVQTDGTNVYWSDQAWQQSFPASIQGMPIGGGTPWTVATGNEIMKTFAIDAQNAYYVSNRTLYSAPLSGGTPKVLAPLSQGGCPQGKMAVQGNSLYWTDTCNMVVMKATW